MEYKITKEQILKIAELNNSYVISESLKEWFPEIFKPKTVTGWYKDVRREKYLWLGYFENNKLKYCIDYLGFWKSEAEAIGEFNPELDREATTQEVETALINEAKKRGFKERVWYRKPTFIEEAKGEMIYSINSGELYFTGSSFTIFRNGVWAEIIPTMTKEQAEKELNCKII